MKKFKKFLVVCLCMTLMGTMLVSCGGDNKEAADGESAGGNSCSNQRRGLGNKRRFCGAVRN